MKIRRGGPGDAGAELALFDEAVAWMVARGPSGQWGTEPIRATRRWSPGCSAWRPAGAVDGRGRRRDRWRVPRREGREPHTAADEPERYVELLLCSRRPAGRNGAPLLEPAAGSRASRRRPAAR